MTEPERRRPNCNVITNAMYPVRGCYQHICAIMSGRIKGACPLRMRKCYLVVYSKENGGLMVKKVCLFSPSTQVSQYILGLNSRTYELLVPLRSVQQPIMPGAYLIGPIQLPKVKLPRLPSLVELFLRRQRQLM